MDYVFAIFIGCCAAFFFYCFYVVGYDKGKESIFYDTIEFIQWADDEKYYQLQKGLWRVYDGEKIFTTKELYGKFKEFQKQTIKK